MSEIKWVSSALYTTTNLSVNAADTSAVITPAVAESDCKALRFIFDYTLSPSLYLSNYNPKVFIKVDVSYKGENVEPDYFFVVVNRESKEAIVELKGQTIDAIRCQIVNSSTSTINFSKFEIYESEDLSPIQVGRLFETDAIQAKVIKTSSFFTEGLFVQMLLTNALSRSVRNAKPGDVVDYILIEGNEIGFYTAVLGSEQEQFTITTTIAGRPTVHTYWYQTIAGDLAYQPITEIDPREFYPNISDTDRDAFKYMVYKPSSISKKLSIEFAEDENGNLTPSMVYGAGTDNLGLGNGQGFTYKNTNGFYHIYQQSDGEVVGIVMDEDGVHIIGWADQHLENITFKDNGVKLKFTGEDEHRFEYVYDDNGTLTGLLQDAAFLTTISYEAGSV
jgi:hypothetical protein